MKFLKEIIGVIGVVFVGGCSYLGVRATSIKFFAEHLGRPDNGISTIIGLIAMALVGWFIWYIWKSGKNSAKEEYERQIEHMRKRYEEQNNGTADQ